LGHENLQVILYLRVSQKCQTLFQLTGCLTSEQLHLCCLYSKTYDTVTDCKNRTHKDYYKTTPLDYVVV